MAIDRRVMWREVLLLVVAALVQVGAPILIAREQADVAVPPFGGVVLLAVAVAAIPLRLRAPVAALLVAFSGTLTYAALDYAHGPIFVALVVTFGNAVLAGRRRAAIVTMFAGYVGFQWLGPVVLDRGDSPDIVSNTALAAWLVALYSAAELIRARRDQARATARARADTLQRQVANERLTIARELHDVVAHNMSLINLQAGVALHVSDDLPDPAREALETIKAASKEALVELRSILGVLRHADDGDGAPRAPAPGLAAVDDLIARARSAGVSVMASISVTADALPRSIDLAAYRIVQESLTNVARHAVPPVAEVVVHQDDHVLVVTVTDQGRGGGRAEPLPSGGNGLPGMRERAESVGGSLVAGPRLGVGFVVEARLPLSADATRSP